MSGDSRFQKSIDYYSDVQSLEYLHALACQAPGYISTARIEDKEKGIVYFYTFWFDNADYADAFKAITDLIREIDPNACNGAGRAIWRPRMGGDQS